MSALWSLVSLRTSGNVPEVESRCSSAWHLDLFLTSCRHTNYSQPLSTRFIGRLGLQSETHEHQLIITVGSQQTEPHVWTFTLTIADYLTVPQKWWHFSDSSVPMCAWVCVCVRIAGAVQSQTSHGAAEEASPDVLPALRQLILIDSWSSFEVVLKRLRRYFCKYKSTLLKSPWRRKNKLKKEK